MNGSFYFLFDIQNKKEIIRYRKLRKCYVVDSDNSDILEYYHINEETNPFHVISRNAAKNSIFEDCILKKIFINFDSDFNTRTQSIGQFLLDFINMDLSDYHDFKDFVFKYGFDIVRNFDKSYQLFLFESITEKEFDIKLKSFFDSIQKQLERIQVDFKNTINFCFINTDKRLSKLTAAQKYFLSYHSYTEDGVFIYNSALRKYSKGISIDFKSFFGIDMKFSNFSLNELIKNKNFTFSPYSYYCARLENALFLSFVNILNINNINIKTCTNCGKYFFPISKSNEKFCTNKISQSSNKTCRDVGAFKVYNNKIKDNEIESLIRTTSACFSMQVKRNPDIDLYKKKYDDWKNNYKQMKILYKNKEITKEEFIKWIKNQRR